MNYFKHQGFNFKKFVSYNFFYFSRLNPKLEDKHRAAEINDVAVFDMIKNLQDEIKESNKYLYFKLYQSSHPGLSY
jgi:hypothetical protein